MQIAQIVEAAIRQTQNKTDKYAHRLLKSKKRDAAWDYKYMEFVTNQKDIFKFYDFMRNTVLLDGAKKKSYLIKFSNGLLKESLYAYYVAEILQPLVRIVSREIKKINNNEIANYFTQRAEQDIAFFKQYAIQKGEEILLKKEAHILRMSIRCYGFAKADFNLNRAVPQLGILTQIISLYERKEHKKIERLMSRLDKATIEKTITEMSEQSSIFSSYREKNEETSPVQISRLIEYSFERTHKNIRFGIEITEDALHTTYKVDELTLLQVLFVAIENAIEAGASGIDVCAGTDFLAITNNGRHLSEIECTLAAEKFFSTKRKAGLGLFIIKKMLWKKDSRLEILINGIKIHFKTKGKKE